MPAPMPGITGVLPCGGRARVETALDRFALRKERVRHGGTSQRRLRCIRYCACELPGRTGVEQDRERTALHLVFNRAVGGIGWLVSIDHQHGDDGSASNCACASSKANPSVSAPAEIALAGERSPRAIPNMPVIALRTDRLKAVGETGSPVLMARSISVVRRSSPCRDANTTRTRSSSATQSWATFRALRDRLLRRRRTIGSMKLISAVAAAAVADHLETGMVQRRSCIRFLRFERHQHLTRIRLCGQRMNEHTPAGRSSAGCQEMTAG